MTEVNKAPSLEEQYRNAAERLESLVRITLPDLHITDREGFRKNVDLILGLLRNTAAEFEKYDRMIESTGKSHDKLLNRVHELTTVRSSQSWADLMAQFSAYVEHNKGSELHPMLAAVMDEIIKTQCHVVAQETQIEELQKRRQHEVRVLSDEEPLIKRIERFKRGIQSMFNSLQSSQNNGMAIPPRGVTRAKNTLEQSCLLVQDLVDLLKARGDKLVELTENAMKETDNLTAIRVECNELKAKNQALEELDKCNESYLEDARAKINAMVEDACAKDKELINLRTSYTECLDRLFKAKVLRPGEIYNVGPLFLPQVTFTPENDGFYEVNPEWHNKVVGGLNLDLHGPADRRAYEMVLTSAVARLHNDSYPVAEGGKEKITVVVAWDAYLSVDRKSPTFSTGKLPLFKHEGNNHLDKVFEGLCEAIGLDEKRIASLGKQAGDDPVASEQVDTEEKPVAEEEPAEPRLLAKYQPYTGHNLYTINREFVIWFSKYKTKGEQGLDELYARNDFRTYLSDRIRKFIGINILPVTIIDWDAAAINGDLNFMCLPLDPYRDSIVKQLNEGLYPTRDGIAL